MMKKRLSSALVALAATVWTGSALAESAVRFVGQPVSSVRGAGRTVPVYGEARVALDGGDEHVLHLTGAGLRQKRVLVNVAVYVAASYLEGEGGISRSDPLTSIAESPTKVLQLTLVRDLTGREIADAFSESLRLNNVDPQEPAIKSIFDRLPQSLAAGSAVTFVGYDAEDGEEAIRLELPGRTIESKGPGLALKMWKIWFGVPSDQGLADLKAALVSGR